MSHLTRKRGLGIGAVLLVVLAVLAAAFASDASVPEPEVVPVSSTELICPDAHTANSNSGAVLTTLSAVTPSNLAVGATGSATVGSLVKPASIATLKGKVHGSVGLTPENTGVVVGRAVLGRAPGFAMDQLSISSRTSDHGLAGTTCTEPDNDVWFVGTGSSVGHQSALFLSDSESTPATVNIALYGSNGQIEAPAGEGVLVKGNGRRIIRLDELAPGAGALAVHVTASSGRVAAAILDTQVNGLLPQGADWVPVSESPATRVVIPGLGAGKGTRKLSIYAPGEGTATVQVSLIGKSGSFAPTGAASVDIDRGKVTTVDLGTAAATDETGAVLTSDVPIVAGVRWTVTAGTVPDIALSAGVSALTAPAVVAGNRNGGGYSTALMLTAPGAAAKVSVQALIAGVPTGKATIVTVGANRTQRITMPYKGDGWFETVITPLPGSGPVYGAVLRFRVVDDAAGTTVSVIRNARITAAVPAAEPDLDVGLGH